MPSPLPAILSNRSFEQEPPESTNSSGELDTNSEDEDETIGQRFDSSVVSEGIRLIATPSTRESERQLDDFANSDADDEDNSEGLTGQLQTHNSRSSRPFNSSLQSMSGSEPVSVSASRAKGFHSVTKPTFTGAVPHSVKQIASHTRDSGLAGAPTTGYLIFSLSQCCVCCSSNLL